MGVLRVFHGCFEVVSTREIQGGSRECKMCFRNWSRVFQLCVEARVTRVYQGR